MKFLKYLFFFLILCFVTNFLLLHIMRKVYEYHYIGIQLKDIGFITVKKKKYLFVLSDNTTAMQKFGTTLALGFKRDNNAELNISLFTRIPPPSNTEYNFATSPLILIPIEYFITKETVITTGNKNYPIAIVKTLDYIQFEVHRVETSLSGASAAAADIH